MVRLSSMLFIFLFVLVICHAASSEARKLSGLEKQGDQLPSLKNSFSLSSFGKGPAVSPAGNKVHAMNNNEKLFVSYQRKINRILEESVPSPGIGH